MKFSFYQIYEVILMKNTKIAIPVFNMTCTSCEKAIENALMEMKGVTSVNANHKNKIVNVEYDSSAIELSSIENEIIALGFSLADKKGAAGIFAVISIFALVIVLAIFNTGFDMSENLQGASFFALFVIGLFTSFHCVGMCGGILLSQTLNKTSADSSEKPSVEVLPAFLYNLGRIISYTIVGASVGFLGSLFSFSIMTRAMLQLFAALFMIGMGLKLAGFPLFSKIGSFSFFSKCSSNKNRSPFVVGLLNGLMPCGPLQTMQVFALGTGSAVTGGLSMFFFSLGTFPLMFGLGALSIFASKEFSKQLIKISGFLVLFLGLLMGSRALALTGILTFPTLISSPNNFKTVPAEQKTPVQQQTPVAQITPAASEIPIQQQTPVAQITPATSKSLVQQQAEPAQKTPADSFSNENYQVINMVVNNSGYVPSTFEIKQNVPVKWIIDAQQLNTCNRAIIIPGLNIEKMLKKGENIIEFTPNKDGNLGFSCWMGMINGNFKVK